jgi:uncharacterized protein YdbL (DUF1318 family)
MSAGVRIAERYRGTPSDQLRAHLRLIRNERRKAAINIVLTERLDAYQAAFDAAQVVLDAIGGTEAKTLHARAMGTALEHSLNGRYFEGERAMGVADALWDYIQERSDH